MNDPLRNSLALAAFGALLLSTSGAVQGAYAVAGDDWPQFMGPNRDGKAPGSIVRTLPPEGPTVLWRAPVGEGFAGPVVVAGKTILFHRVDDEEVVEARDALSGAPLWRTSYPTSYRDDFGFDEGPRSAPTVVDGAVYTCGAQGAVQALDLSTGERRWSVDSQTRFSPEKGFFGAACSPLVAGGHVMINLGGRDGSGIVAFAADSGEVVWTATEDPASYSAPILADFGDGPRALFFTRMGLVDLDPADGTVRATLRWRSRSRASVNAASPVVVGNRVFLSASYGTGAILLERTADGYAEVWSNDEALSNHYATSIHYQGVLYGYHGRQEYGQALRAVDAATGAVRWEMERFGAGSLLLAGEILVILRESGELVLADATPEAFRPTARAQLLDRVVRAFPALADGVLYARNGGEVAAFDLRQR